MTSTNEENTHARKEPTPEEIALKKLREEELAPVLEQEFAGFADRGHTPYMDRKAIPKLYGARIQIADNGLRLVIPLKDIGGKFWAYQRIWPEKFKIADQGKEKFIDKLTPKGARTKACFFILDSREILPEASVYIAEGFATAASIYQALGENAPVVCALYAANLPEVGKALHGRYPKARLVFCADNDQWKPARGNAGRVWAEKAAAEVGGEVRYPVFGGERSENQKGPTDFNDLHMSEGLETVLAQIQEQAKEPNPETGHLQTLAGVSPQGKPTKPGEKRVVEYLLNEYGNRIVAQGSDIFLYENGYWQWQDDAGIKRIKRQLSHIFGPNSTAKDVEGAFKSLLIQIPGPRAGVDMFQPRYFMSNFKNGTLHVLTRAGGKPELVFRAHNPDDFIVNQLPLDYPGAGGEEARNAKFDAWLDKIFLGDADKALKIRSLAQLYGAVLMPSYSKIFFMVGPRGSGKSTACKLLYRLVDKQNVCHVDPGDFHGFNMEGMAGKLLNMDTDIDLHRPIKDSVIKKICDGIPFRIRRKNVKDLLALLPLIHVWAGNGMPASLEGATGAYGRRVVVLRFGSFSAEAEGEELDFAQQLWEAGPEGILAFALRGLGDLLEQRGIFTVPPSSSVALHDWDARSDLVAQYLDAMDHGEVDGNNQFRTGKGRKISRSAIWENFSAWIASATGNHRAVSQRAFYDALRGKGYGEYKDSTGRGFTGIGVEVAPDSAC